MNLRLPYVFVGLDETLVHVVSRERANDQKLVECDSFGQGSSVIFLRPGVHELLSACREQALEVVLLTLSERDHAAEISRAFGLGFAANQIFSRELFAFGEKDLAPTSALIDNEPADHENARLKMRTLGIGFERYLQIPAFKPPKFPSCRTFLLGLPYRLENLALELSRRSAAHATVSH
jgi:hypothetical protein